MQKPIILFGTGEMGSVFALGFLKTGYTIVPTLRDTNTQQLAKQIPNPELVLISVAENDLQNELLPQDWLAHNIIEPTVIPVWFEKKPGQDFKVLISSPCYGSKAKLLKQALQSLTIPCHIVKNEEQLLFELVVKNVYILILFISSNSQTC